MRKIAIVIAILCGTTPALARPGFYIGLGLGGSGVSGEDVDAARLSPGGVSFGALTATTDFGGSFSLDFHMGFNILGYGAIETRLSGQGTGLISNPPAIEQEPHWAAHWHTGLRIYPMWHWQEELLPDYLQPLEPSIFVGWGTTYQGYSMTPANDVGWRTWNSWRFGLAAEYFIVSYFKLGLEYTFVSAPHDLFIFDYSDKIDFDVNPSATTWFHQLYLMASFHFTPAE